MMFDRFKGWLFSKGGLEIQVLWILFTATLAAIALGFGYYLIDFWPVYSIIPDAHIVIVGVTWLMVLAFTLNVLLFLMGLVVSASVLFIGEEKLMDWLDKFID